MKIVSIIGARPQFVKAAPVSREIRKRHTEILLHTGQHYDRDMSDIFFNELEIPSPEINLGVGSGSHGAQTGMMLERVEKVLLSEKPDWVLVYGDTNSTLAGALAASKLHIRVAHVEAGLRSFNRSMPEEINRVVADHLSNLLFCPSQTAVDNLADEGIRQGVHLVGDVMGEALRFAAQRAYTLSGILEKYDLREKGYLLATVHRAENTDDPVRLQNILTAFSQLGEKVIFPVHPRTRQKLVSLNLEELQLLESNIVLINPLGYLDMVRLEQAARMILTDSGGIQKEAYWLGVPCITLREETEWVETVLAGWNVLVGAEQNAIVDTVKSYKQPQHKPALYGSEGTSARIIELISEY